MSGHACSQILEMTDGDFTAVGKDITTEAKGALPPGPGIGDDEGAVRIPRQIMLDAMMDILSAA